MARPEVSRRLARLALASTASLLVAHAAAQGTVCDTLCVGAGHSQGVNFPQLSADGRWLAFGSTASTLVPGDTNGYLDVFVADLVDGGFERVSVGTNGAQGDL